MRKLCLRLVGFGALILVSGCVVGPDFKEPNMNKPEHFINDSAKAESVVALKWWNLFNDPLLNEMVITALQENKNLKITASRIEEARATLGFTGADRYPRFDIQGSASRGDFATGSNVVSNSYSIGPSMSWELDFWGKFQRATESARAQMLASEASYNSVQISLISSVVSTYFTLLDYKERLKIAKYTLVTRDKSLNIIHQRFEKGVIPMIDVNQSEIQREIAASSIPQFERLAAQTENALSILLGRNPKIIEHLGRLHDQLIPPSIPAGLPSELLLRRPDVLEAKYLLMSKNANIGVATAQRFPSISLTGVFGLASSSLSSGNIVGWNAGGGLLGPIFDFNKSKSRVEIEKARMKQALYHYEDVVLTAFRDVEDALIEVDTFKKQLRSAERQFNAAKNAENLSQQRYDHGVTSYLELLESQRSAFNAALQLSFTKKDYLNAYVKLYKALGGGWITDKKEVPQEK